MTYRKISGYCVVYSKSRSFYLTCDSLKLQMNKTFCNSLISLTSVISVVIIAICSNREDLTL